MSVRFKYYLRGCGLGILVASLVFIVSLHAHGGAMSDEKAMQRASELGMIMPDDTQTQEAETQTTELPVKETNLPDTQRTTQAVTQKVPQNDTQKQTERDTSSEQNDTPKESEKKAEEKKKTQDSQKKEEEKKKAQETEKEETKKEKVSITIKGGEVCREIAQDLQEKGLVRDAEDFRKYMQVQTIGHDKLNQLRHVRFFKDLDGLHAHMRKHADILRPKFELVLDTLDKELSGLGIGEWTKPHGGYFISFDSLDGCAKAIVARAKEAGVVLTGAGATYPYGKDPKDSNIRIAPSFPTLEDLGKAAQVFVLCVKLVSVEKLLG